MLLVGTFSYNAGTIFFKLLKNILKLISREDNIFIIVNNNEVLEFFFNDNGNMINLVSTYFEHLFGSIPHNIVIVCCKIYDKFSYILNWEEY